MARGIARRTPFRAAHPPVEEREEPTPPSRVVLEVDGIQEEDNQLPRWWLYILYGTTAFAFGYWFYYQTFHLGPTSIQAYKQAKAEAAARVPKATITAETAVAYAKDPDKVSEGQKIFTSTCATCHRADGGGQVGPNLTDEYWIGGGGTPEGIFTTIKEGRPNKGMPTWGPQLGDENVAEVASYVLSIKNTHVANGKAPQGDKAP